MWKRIAIGVLATSALVGGGAWLLGWFSDDPALVEVRQLQAKLADPKLSDDQRRGLFDTLRTKMEALPEASRRDVFASGMRVFQRQFDARMDQLLAMTPPERNKALDEDIDRMQRMRAQFAQQTAAAGKGGPPGPLPWAGFRGASLTDAQWNNFTRSMLGRTTPEGRAKMQEYFRMLSERMKQRGLSPMGGPGGGFGRS